MRDIEIKRDIKYEITHPYTLHNPPIPVEKIHKYKVTLKLCTLLKGVPYGPAHIQYTHPSNKSLSFDGVGVFTEGRLHSGPFTAINGSGVGTSYS